MSTISGNGDPFEGNYQFKLFLLVFLGSVTHLKSRIWRVPIQLPKWIISRSRSRIFIPHLTLKILFIPRPAFYQYVSSCIPPNLCWTLEPGLLIDVCSKKLKENIIWSVKQVWSSVKIKVKVTFKFWKQGDSTRAFPDARISKWSHFILFPVAFIWSAIADVCSCLDRALKCSIFLSCVLFFL